MADGRRARLGATLLAAVFGLALIGLPVANLLAVALGDGQAAIQRALGGPLAVRAIANSLWTSAAVAILAVAAGTAAALVTERLATRGRNVLRAGILAQLLLPPFVLAFGWTRAFGPRGLADQLLGIQVPGLYGPLGIVIVLTAAATPLAWLTVAAALASRVEPELELAARASGAGAARALTTVTLPLLRPAIAAAGVVTFVFALNAFGVPEVLGAPAGFATITTRLYQDLALSSSPAAFARAITLAATLVVLATVVVGSADALLAGRGGGARRSGAPGMSASAGSVRWAIALLVTWIVVMTGLPLLATILTALTRAVGLAPVPANWTLANFADAGSDGRFWGALGRSLLVAAAAATAVLALGALVVAGLRGRRARVGGVALTLGFAVPGSALAVAVLLAYGGVLRDTLLIIGVAYVAKFWALGHRQLAGSVDRLPGDALWAARASGAGALSTLRTVAAPILRPSLIAAWVIVFGFGLHELTMSTLLYGPGTATLAVHVLNVQQLGDPTVSAALGVILTVLVAVAAVPLLVIGRVRVAPDAGIAG